MKRILQFGFFVVFVASSLNGFAQTAPVKKVLAEIFRNTGCVPCKQTDPNFEAFAAQQGDIQIVYIHNKAPDPVDPFAIATGGDAIVRQNFYGVQGDPTVFIKGFNAGTGAQTLDNWKTLAANPAASTYSATLTASVSVTGNIVTIDLHADGTSGGKQVRPYAMLVESGIMYDNSAGGYGNPPNNTWDNIFRSMIPAAAGGDPVVISGPIDFHYTYDASGKPWVFSNCKIIAFLQEVTAQTQSSHPIDAFTVASVKSAVKDFNANATSISAPVPNPSQSFARIPFHVAAPANVKIVINDGLGREIAVVYNGFVLDSESSAIFMPASVSNGIFYARMYANGAFVGMQKLIFAK
jgi:hypothetical protein